MFRGNGRPSFTGKLSLEYEEGNILSRSKLDWKQHDFSVNGSYLQFVDDAEKPHNIPLGDCSVVQVKRERPGHEFVFRINLPKGTQLGKLASTRENPPRLVLAADTDADREQWVRALGDAGANTAEYLEPPRRTSSRYSLPWAASPDATAHRESVAAAAQRLNASAAGLAAPPASVEAGSGSATTPSKLSYKTLLAQTGLPQSGLPPSRITSDAPSETPHQSATRQEPSASLDMAFTSTATSRADSAREDSARDDALDDARDDEARNAERSPGGSSIGGNGSALLSSLREEDEELGAAGGMRAASASIAVVPPAPVAVPESARRDSAPPRFTTVRPPSISAEQHPSPSSSVASVSLASCESAVSARRALVGGGATAELSAEGVHEGVHGEGSRAPRRSSSHRRGESGSTIASYGTMTPGQRLRENMLSRSVHESSPAHLLKGDTTSTEKRASMIQRMLKGQYLKRKNMCDPMTFRATPRSSAEPSLADFGQIRLGSDVGRPAKFLHLSDTPAPRWYTLAQRTRNDLHEYADHVLDMMELHWNMSPASVILSVTGGAQDFVLSPMLQSAFSHGLARAARATNAWVVSGGTDSGVMRLVGQALAEHDAQVHCLGIATWGVIHGRNHMEGCHNQDSVVVLERKHQNSGAGVNLERNHSHFLLVDNQKDAARGDAPWGGEIAFRFALEAVYCQKKRIPRVLIVVQGGPKTLESVYEAVQNRCPVVLVADAGGVSTMLHHFLQAARDERSPDFGRGRVPEEFIDKYSNPKAQEMLAYIARMEGRNRLISSFALGGMEGTSAELDLHILNAIISDTSHIKNEARLRLAVEWNRVDVVERVLVKVSDAPNIGDVMRQALQCAIEHRRVEIIKVLLRHAATLGERVVIKVDFIALYDPTRRHQPRIFTSSSVLRASLNSETAIHAMGQPTSVEDYREVLGPFLKEYCPDIEHRLDKLLLYQQIEARRRGKGRPGQRATVLDHTSSYYPSLSFSDLCLWAVLVGDSELAEVFWENLKHQRHGDPIRLALIAAQTSKRCAEAVHVEKERYSRNAELYERWACELLRRCENEWDAMGILMRAHNNWPHTILRTAMRGHPDGCKSFIGETFVQRLVDKQWRGSTYHSTWELPEATGAVQILMNCVIPGGVLRMQRSKGFKEDRVGREVSTLRSSSLGPRRLTRSDTATSATFKDASHVSHHQDFAYAHPATLSLHGRRSRTLSSIDLNAPPGEERPLGALLECFKRRVWHRWTKRGYESLNEDMDLSQSERSASSRLGAPSPSRATSAATVAEASDAHDRETWKHFLEVPHVKFILKLTSYFLFLALYIAVIMQRDGYPSTRLTLLDYVFYAWAFSLFIEEIYQWELDARRGEAHLIEWVKASHENGWRFELNKWNAIDVFSLSLLLVIFVLRLFASAACEDPYDEYHGIDGSRGGGDVAAAVSLQHLIEDDQTSASDRYDHIWLELYGGCRVLWWSHVLLSTNVILCFIRVLNWLTVWEGLGTLSVILMALVNDVQVFLLIFGLVVGSFAVSFVGLMPTLGTGSFDASGPFQTPFWAMFGEFGELPDLSLHGWYIGSYGLWFYTFVSQVLLVNLLIAMMTETYYKVKMSASNEFQFQRILIVDEFMGSVYFVPPPFSMPYLGYNLLRGLPHWIRYWCDQRADVVSFEATVALSTGGSFDADHYKGTLCDKLHLHHEDVAIQLLADGGGKELSFLTRVCLTHGAGAVGEAAAPSTARNGAALRRGRGDDQHAKQEEELSTEAFEVLDKMTKSAASAYAVINQLFARISKLTVEQRSYKESLRPRPADKAEDLMTFSLPGRPGGKHSTRRDLIMLKEWLDEKEAKRQKSMETRLLDKSDKMHVQMLKTQEVTFTLKKRIDTLMEHLPEIVKLAEDNVLAAHGADPQAEAPCSPRRSSSAPLSDLDAAVAASQAATTPAASTPGAATPGGVPTGSGSERKPFRRLSTRLKSAAQMEITTLRAARDAHAAVRSGSSTGAPDATHGSSRGGAVPLPVTASFSSNGEGMQGIDEDDSIDTPSSRRLRERLQVTEGELGKLQQREKQRHALVHQKTRHAHPRLPPRFPVSDEQVDWAVPWKEYEPVSFTSEGVFKQDSTKLKGGWADPPDPTVLGAAWDERVSHEGPMVFFRNGRPRNPRGRTGMVERGVLGKWGPNHAADSIVTRYNPARPSQLQMVAIQRRDTGEWAIPGGMVDAGETVSVTVKREFLEETGNLPEGEREIFKQRIDQLFQAGRVVYRGYVDDPRNTDNAWMETTAFHYHCPKELGELLKFRAGDDAVGAMWLDIDLAEAKYVNLYASHREWVDRVDRELKAQREDDDVFGAMAEPASMRHTMSGSSAPDVRHGAASLSPDMPPLTRSATSPSVPVKR